MNQANSVPSTGNIIRYRGLRHAVLVYQLISIASFDWRSIRERIHSLKGICAIGEEKIITVKDTITHYYVFCDFIPPIMDPSLFTINDYGKTFKPNIIRSTLDESYSYVTNGRYNLVYTDYEGALISDISRADQRISNLSSSQTTNPSIALHVDWGIAFRMAIGAGAWSLRQDSADPSDLADPNDTLECVRMNWKDTAGSLEADIHDHGFPVRVVPIMVEVSSNIFDVAVRKYVRKGPANPNFSSVYGPYIMIQPFTTDDPSSISREVYENQLETSISLEVRKWLENQIAGLARPAVTIDTESGIPPPTFLQLPMAPASDKHAMRPQNGLTQPLSDSTMAHWKNPQNMNTYERQDHLPPKLPTYLQRNQTSALNTPAMVQSAPNSGSDLYQFPQGSEVLQAPLSNEPCDATLIFPEASAPDIHVMQQNRTQSPNAPGAAPPAPQGRKRQACDFCRNRKTRCDQSKPICGTCKALNRQCFYYQRVRGDKQVIPNHNIFTSFHPGYYTWASQS